VLARCEVGWDFRAARASCRGRGDDGCVRDGCVGDGLAGSGSCRMRVAMMLGRVMFQRRMDPTSESRGCHHDRAAGGGDLDHTCAAEHLNCPLSAKVRTVRGPPDDPAEEPEVMTEREDRRGEKCGGRVALKCAAAHLAHELRVGAAAGSAPRQMRSRDSLILGVCRAAGIGGNGALAVITHAPGRRDHGYPFELSLRGALSCLDGLHRGAQDAGRQLDPGAAHGHHCDDVALQGAELGHEINCPSDAILQCNHLIGSEVIRHDLSGDCLKAHARAAADAKAVATLVMLAKQDTSRRPERADQVLLRDDRPPHHHDDADGVV
jgi:hypothetical protein